MKDRIKCETKQIMIVNMGKIEMIDCRTGNPVVWAPPCCDAIKT